MVLPPHLAVKNSADVPLDRLVQFIRIYEEAVTGTAWCTREDVLLETDHPGYDPRCSSWCLTHPPGDVAARAALTVRGGPSLDCTLTVLPGEDDEIMARALLTRLMDRAAVLSRKWVETTEVTVGGVLIGDPVVPRVLEEMGFRRRVTYVQSEIDLFRAPLPPDLPAGALVRRIGIDPDDVRALHTIHGLTRTRGARTLGYEMFRARLAQFDVTTERGGGVSLLMEMAGRPVGHVLAQAGGRKGRIVDMTVAPASRGLGIGLALIAIALGELRDLGCDRAVLALDASRLRNQRGLHRLLAVTAERAVTQYVRSSP
ncbi:GNAT family N-acetyltransferase [Streptomyces alkaliphilus]|uniref:GNAT family N-acetyltransferase n=1 Tax=Streptomyces alkaliphilus TaxID=1472722 RepID=A0A7W3XZU8_9ACTN|nr:GNAT family N-acetyltransferase [Streptomyces alkaliphilus]MBB0242651.1 GNAT family N-acetyltransferase [Streptomyces alkaliphilus]